MKILGMEKLILDKLYELCVGGTKRNTEEQGEPYKRSNASSVAFSFILPVYDWEPREAVEGRLLGWSAQGGSCSLEGVTFTTSRYSPHYSSESVQSAFSVGNTRTHRICTCPLLERTRVLTYLGMN